MPVVDRLARGNRWLWNAPTSQLFLYQVNAIVGHESMDAHETNCNEGLISCQLIDSFGTEH